MYKQNINKEIVTPSISKSSIFISDHIRVTKESQVDLHIHKEMELLFQESGRKTVIVNQHRYEMTGGDIILFNSNTPHKVISHIDSVDSYVQFRPETEANTLNSFQSFMIFCHGNVFFFKNGSESNTAIRKCIQNLIEENEKKEFGYQAIIKNEIAKLLTLLQRYNILENQTLQYKPWFLSSLYYIEEHFNEDILLSDICAKANVTPTHFCRVFREATKTNFSNYLNYVRISKAESLLLETKDSISDIATQTGFSSIAYFSKVFKQYKYCTPGEYRKINNIACE